VTTIITMELNESLVVYIATTYYNMKPLLVSVRKMYGYSDSNYAFTDSNDNQCYFLKIVNPDESHENLVELIDEAIDGVQTHLNDNKANLIVTVPKLIRTSADKSSGYVSIKQPDGRSIWQSFKLFELYDGITVYDFLRGHQGMEMKCRLMFYKTLGMACRQIFEPLSNLCHLRGRLQDLRAKLSFPWNIMTCNEHIKSVIQENVAIIPDDQNSKLYRNLIETALEEFESIQQQLNSLPQYILHGDLGTRNILLARHGLADFIACKQVNGGDICLIDFQDIQVGPQIVDFSTSLLYLIIEQDDIPFENALKLITHWFFEGYQSTKGLHPLDSENLKYTPTLMKIRLCQSLLNGLIAIKLNPDNQDVLQTNQKGWQLLTILSSADDKWLPGTY